MQDAVVFYIEINKINLNLGDFLTGIKVFPVKKEKIVQPVFTI